MEDIPTSTLMALFGFFCGVVAGATARHVRFCTMGAIEDKILGQDSKRLKSWFLAIAVAMILVQLIRISGITRIDDTFYLSPNYGWLGAIIGGLLFGLGMAFTGTCAFGSLIRLGGGDLRSLVVLLVMGLTAYMTARGLTGQFRVAFIERWNLDLTSIGGQGIPHILSGMIGIHSDHLWLPLALLFAATVVCWCLRDPEFMKSKKDILSGIVIGLVVASAFAATSIWGDNPFERHRVESLSYVLPPGNTIIYFLTYPGSTLNFGIGLTLGTLFGAYIAAALNSELRTEAFDDPREMKHGLVGAFLMGFGGVVAYGCTIGQGISGMATLSASAPLALAAIFISASFGLNLLLTGNWREAIGMLFLRFEKSASKTSR